MTGPMNGETNGEAPEHRQIPGGVEGANPTLVLQRDHIERLMHAVLDSPVAAFVPEQRRGVVAARRMSGQQEELFEGGSGFAGIVNCLLQFRALLGERKPHLLGVEGKAGDSAGFRTTFI